MGFIMNKIFIFLFCFSSVKSQVVDLFISDWYIGWRGDGVYNNLVELYNPKEDTINLTDYLFRRTQNGSDWLSSDDEHEEPVKSPPPKSKTVKSPVKSAPAKAPTAKKSKS